jgi:hypothetical protein
VTNHRQMGALLWNVSPSSTCTQIACHNSCGVIPCSANQWKLDWPYFTGCFGLYKDPVGCTWPASRHAKNTSLGCPLIAVTTCHATIWAGTDLIGGGHPSVCNWHTSTCSTGTHPYYGEANRALMASLGVTTTGLNVYANFSWSS